ncbi:MAG: SUF system NifU family Fe-S cluster assembly protein [Candidatus Melainabacteria bacterium]|nr:SUF system NifU family Fe-S cluster assembly protein [Candidatus Melainabacteria bacterium]
MVFQPASGSELYQELVLDHNRRPRHFRVLENASAQGVGKNPNCGDHFTIYVRVNEANVAEEVTFQGFGCAISKASASMMTALLHGKDLVTIHQLSHQFRLLATGNGAEVSTETRAALGSLAWLESVSRYPMRVKCATLAWHALEAALSGQTEEVTTE